LRLGVRVSPEACGGLDDAVSRLEPEDRTARCAIRSIDGSGLVARRCGTNGKDLDETRVHARVLFRDTVAQGPAVAGWSGWFADVVEACGGFATSAPLCVASETARKPAAAA